MIIGVLNELDDPRVALSPETTAKLVKLGHEVHIEPGAGSRAAFPDSNYEEAGANTSSRETILGAADFLAAITPPSLEEMGKMKQDAMIVAMFNPLVEKDFADSVASLPVRAFSMDRIPRTSIAQSMDVLSSMASMAGYKAVLVGANHLPGYMPMLMTAAGTIPPAKVLVLGAGVAGLQAIATARRLGATVEAFDVRSAVKTEVQSLGAKFVEVEGAKEDDAAGGYAVEQSEEYKQRQSELIQERATKADIVISTANIPGRKAPVLIKENTVHNMKPGAVIVDLAAATGGNCALTENDKVIQVNGVTIVGKSNLPAEMPNHASKLYSNNVLNFFKFMTKEGPDQVDLSHEIFEKTRIVSATS
ncbi:MAG: Re/Si-specific NAD(P)(+) transhydrogenase subunit alpha [Bacteroidota bacterium]